MLNFKNMLKKYSTNNGNSKIKRVANKLNRVTVHCPLANHQPKYEPGIFSKLH